jgi:3-hydroxybutyrate dehydrogenase
MLEANAVKRMIEPDEVADAVAYLCRPGAWTMTGSVLRSTPGDLLIEHG